MEYNQKYWLYFCILILCASLGQVASDLYLPSLPAIQIALSTKTSLVQLSISLYMMGYAGAQLIFAPLSDGFGRRPPLFVGFMICLVGTFLCMTANSIEMLLLGRCLQGLGAGGTVGIGRAAFRDVFAGKALARFGSYLAMANIFLVAGAPFLGGYLQTFFGWRASFIFLFAYALFGFLIVFRSLPETNQHRHRDHLRWPVLKQNIHTLLLSQRFVLYAVCIFVMYAGILAWLTAGPILFQNTLGLTPVQFGSLSLGVGAMFFVGSFLNTLLVRHFSLPNLLLLGFSLPTLAAFILFIEYSVGILTPTAVYLPLLLVPLGCSFVFGNSFAGALTPFPHIAGMAAALFSFAQMFGGVVASSALAYSHEDNQLPLAVSFAVVGGIGLMASYFLRTLSLRERSARNDDRKG